MPKGALSNILSGDLECYEGAYQPIQQYGPYGPNVQDMYSGIQLEKGWGRMMALPPNLRILNIYRDFARKEVIE
tara:strand:+ start:81 stop:302 length:222 start_codon:yes stop_codon:yes gene_type:complete